MGAVTGSVRIAVDGGGSKTVVAVAEAASGAVLSRVEGPGCRYDVLGIAAAEAIVNDLTQQALALCALGQERVDHAALFLTTIDFPEDRDVWLTALASRSWAQRSLRVDNDIFALLRSGTAERDAAAVVCGTGMNGVGVRSDGASATLVALGRISGDFGGGASLAQEVLWHAARADDGRGPQTALRDALLEWTGARDMMSLFRMIRFDGLDPEAWMDRVPDLFSIADDGDAVAIDLLRRQGQEIGIVGASLLERLGLSGEPVPVVIGGGIVRSGHPLIVTPAAEALAARCPAATLIVPERTPIFGAIDLALDYHAPN